MAGKIKFSRLLPPLVWAGLIFYLSSLPSLRSPFGIGDIYLRKIAHFTEYFILYILIMPNLKINNSKSRVLVLIIVFIYAVLDEFHQNFVPGRHMSLYDISIDWIGALAGYICSGLKENAVIRSTET